MSTQHFTCYGPEVTVTGDPVHSDRLLLFVHGYNDDIADARTAYNLFLDSYPALTARKALSEVYDFGFVYWPGKVWNCLSFAAYAPEMREAEEAARRLALLLDIRERRKVSIIAHSMGNRFALQLVSTTSRVEYERLILMAAAVPTAEVQPHTIYPDYSDAVREFTSTLCLYSPRDSVLRAAFPVGEFVGGDGPRLEAIGLEGRPDGLWTHTQNCLGYDHSDYWTRPQSVNEAVGFLK